MRRCSVSRAPQRSAVRWSALPATARRRATLAQSAWFALLAVIGAGCAPGVGPAAPAAVAGTTVIVVRHAERADDGSTRDPQLSEAGERRAAALAAALADAGVGAILVTQYQRTAATAAPLAERLAVPMEVVATGNATDAHIEALHAAVLERRGAGVVLVVGHSNTVPALVRRLSGRPVPDLRDDEYGDMYVILLPAPGTVTGGGARVLRARF
jgi:phosphohistidine phosphatase SixA